MALNGFIEPLIYNEENLDMLGWVLFIGVCFCFISFIAGYFIGKLHRRAEMLDGVESRMTTFNF
jgi:phosphotransferase system  glucose/maltose/N-acetylglucosamine-specific IIC component